MRKKFNRDISEWDVSSVIDMNSMFSGATSFNHDLSKWDMSSVMNMNYMFQDAKSFKQTLRGATWSSSKTITVDMFVGSYGSISRIEVNSEQIDLVSTTAAQERRWHMSETVPKR